MILSLRPRSPPNYVVLQSFFFFFFFFASTSPGSPAAVFRFLQLLSSPSFFYSWPHCYVSQDTEVLIESSVEAFMLSYGLHVAPFQAADITLLHGRQPLKINQRIRFQTRKQNRSPRRLFVDQRLLHFPFVQTQHPPEETFNPFLPSPPQNDTSCLDYGRILIYLRALRLFMSRGGFPSGVQRERKEKFSSFQMGALCAGGCVKQM